MTRPRTKRVSETVAALLAGAWRAAPPPLACAPEEVAAVAPSLEGSGLEAIVWWRLSRSSPGACPSLERFRDAHRHQLLQCALQERQAARAFEILEAAAVEPLLVKGPACARLYPARGLRPAGDVDLIVRHSQAERARRALDAAGLGGWVDLHAGGAELGRRDLEEVFARSRAAEVCGAPLRVPCAEDHFRLVCLHMLKHGAWRPLWLCDVAAGLESRPGGFDWDYCLGTGREAERVACAAGLAHALLGAELAGTPFESRAVRLPRWLAPAVLERWERPHARAHEARPRMVSTLGTPSAALGAARSRWPDPVTATVNCRAPFNGLPRWPLQLANFAARSARFLYRLPGDLRAGRTRGRAAADARARGPQLTRGAGGPGAV